jgi:hypothetical protein
MNDGIIPYLFGVTFALVIVYALYQWWRAKKARAEHHTSASAKANHEAGAPGQGSRGQGANEPPARR